MNPKKLGVVHATVYLIVGLALLFCVFKSVSLGFVWPHNLRLVVRAVNPSAFFALLSLVSVLSVIFLGGSLYMFRSLFRK